MKHMKIKMLMPVMLIVGLAAFVSCEKEGVILDTTTPSIKTFSSVEEYFTELNIVSKMSTSDLCDYEKENGYYSLRRKCEEVYMKANPKNFKSKEDFFTFVENNSDYIELITDSDNEKTLEIKYPYNLDRYFAGEDGLFRISNTLCKVIGDITCYTNSDNYEEIKMIDENNYTEYLDDKYFSFSSKPTTKWGNAEEDTTSISGNDRVYIALIFDCTGYLLLPDAGLGYPYLRCSFTVRPYHKVLGIWYWCTRTISAEYDAKIVSQHHDDIWQAYYPSESVSGYYNSVWSDTWYQAMKDLNGNIVSGVWQSHFIENMYFEGDTPDVSPAILEWDDPNDYN